MEKVFLVHYLYDIRDLICIWNIKKSPAKQITTFDYLNPLFHNIPEKDIAITMSSKLPC